VTRQLLYLLTVPGTIGFCDVRGRRTTLAQNCPVIAAYNDKPESSCSVILCNGYLGLGDGYIFGLHSPSLTIGVQVSLLN
jgi:alpha-D-ribose 1-methylphosphonate 5-triphosphate synthase subunit PhnG